LLPGAISPEGKATGRNVDHSRPSSDDVKNEWLYTSTPLMPSWFVYHTPNLHFYLY
jgi:hypothetical protein